MQDEEFNAIQDAITSLTDDERFDLCRLKPGPLAEHRSMTEMQYAEELADLWDEKDGLWTNLLRDETNLRYRRGLETLLPYWTTDQAREDLARNDPKGK